MTVHALSRVQTMHELVDLWDITFCNRGFLGPKYYWHLQILRPRALFYKTDCTRRSKFLTHALNMCHLGIETCTVHLISAQTSLEGIKCITKAKE